MTTLKNTDPFAQIVSKNPRMQDVIEKAKKFALLDVPLLIQGETGTGKDVIAKACHGFGERRNHEFLAVNCAGIPREDAETEMFGRRNKDGEFIGFFEYADGGTVLLDGVEELPLTLQAKLLRFLSDGTFSSSRGGRGTLCQREGDLYLPTAVTTLCRARQNAQ